MAIDKSSVFNKLINPIISLAVDNPFSRKSNVLSDELWVRTGISRVLSFVRSGRDYLQNLATSTDTELTVSHFFGALKSERRLKHCQKLNHDLCDEVMNNSPIPDPFAELPELADFRIYAGDGHYHKAPIHEQKVDGKAYATLHFYSLNLRTQMISHMGAGAYGNKRKKEHDMHFLKRLTTELLRQRAPKGTKCLYTWDCAGIDFLQWQNWKNTAGVYFLSHEKKLNRLMVIGEPLFDKNDPVNAGVRADQRVSSANGVIVRRVKYSSVISSLTYILSIF